MPIPFLPIEIIAEIASHLRNPKSYQFNEQIEAGKTISLVSRAWSDTGQGMRWGRVGVDIASLPSLSSHFTLHPRLPRLVRGLKQKGDLPYVEEAMQANGGFGALVTLLDTLVELNLLEIFHYCQDLDPVFLSAGSLARLQQFHLTSSPRLYWSPKLASLLASGFPSLRRLSLSATRLLGPEEVTIAQLHRRSIPLSIPELALDLDRPFTETTGVQFFLSTFDIGALRSCTLSGTVLCDAVFDWLVMLPKLEELVVIRDGFTDMSSFSEEVLSNLPRIAQLHQIIVEFSVQLVSSPSPVTLVEVIASLPPHLCKFQAKQLVFPDFGSFESRQIPSDLEEYRLIIALLPKLPGGGHPVLRLWNNAKSGDNVWYREESDKVV
ncbi:hypothetical protein JCM5353_006160 [Sporobolomyces roseus]